MTNRTHGRNWIALGLAACAGMVCADRASGATAMVYHQPPSSATFTDADDLLTALETADRDLARLSAQVRYTRTFDLAGDRQVRDGTLYFIAESQGEQRQAVRRFAIDFTRLTIGRRQENERQTYVFDGQWLVEMQHRDRQAIRRQIAPPGATFDPLRIGEGPMPIPIGQRKRDILARYDAQLLPADDGLWLDPAQRWTSQEEAEARALREFVKDSWQLLLTPTPERADDDDFSQIRLWYAVSRDGRLLPRMVRTVNQAGDVAVVQLFSPRVNSAATIPTDVMRGEVPPGWNVQTMPWRGEPMKEPDGEATQPK